jgi:hypothetical protein
MQTLHASTRAIEHTSLQSIVTTRDAASSSRPSLLRNATQNPHRHPPSVAASKFRPVARQVASSHWVCAGCSSRFLAGDQKIWGLKQAAVESLGSARKRTRTVTGQWFHFNSTKSLNVPVREESPGIDEYLRVSYFPYAPVGSSPGHPIVPIMLVLSHQLQPVLLFLVGPLIEVIIVRHLFILLF